MNLAASTGSLAGGGFAGREAGMPHLAMLPLGPWVVETLLAIAAEPVLDLSCGRGGVAVGLTGSGRFGDGCFGTTGWGRGCVMAWVGVRI